MLIQLLKNGTIDPGWVIAVLLSISIFFLVRTLNKIEKRLENHDVKLDEHGKEIAAMKRADEILLPEKYRKKKEGG